MTWNFDQRKGCSAEHLHNVDKRHLSAPLTEQPARYRRHPRKPLAKVAP